MPLRRGIKGSQGGSHFGPLRNAKSPITGPLDIGSISFKAHFSRKSEKANQILL